MSTSYKIIIYTTSYIINHNNHDQFYSQPFPKQRPIIKELETASTAIRMDYYSAEFVRCTHGQWVTVCGVASTVHSRSVHIGITHDVFISCLLTLPPLNCNIILWTWPLTSQRYNFPLLQTWTVRQEKVQFIVLVNLEPTTKVMEVPLNKVHYPYILYF